MLSKRYNMFLTRLSLSGVLLFSVCCAHHVSSKFKNETLRLNTPQLISEYQQKNFSYGKTREGFGCGGADTSHNTSGCSPEFIFNSKKGNCAAYTTFAVYCLRQAGYEAYPAKVYSKWPVSFIPRIKTRDYHYVALYKERGRWFLIDNGRPTGNIGILGPFDSKDSLPYKVLNIED